MSFIFNILYLTVFFSTISVAAKLLIGSKFRFKESIYLASAALLLAIIHLVSPYVPLPIVARTCIQIPLFFFYFYKINAYSTKKSFILTLLAQVIEHASNLLVITAFRTFFPAYYSSILEHLTSSLLFLRTVPFLLTLIVCTALVTLLFLKATRKLRDNINQSERAITILSRISITCLIAMQLTTSFLEHQNEFIEFVSSFWVLALLGFSVAVFVSFFFYMKFERERVALRQKEVEQQIQQEYTNHIEEQQISMRKFKHDYKNILLSIDSFVGDEDWVGLKQYMPKVNAASSIITKDEFALENLSKIRLPEIKGLLAAKLMMAQNISMDIHTSFEAHEEVDHIPVDSVVMVRILGIIMDNALEELDYLGAGALMVACYKSDAGITFVVQNTCRTDIQPLYKLGQIGYSTKGEGQGLGLSNLVDLVATHSDKLSLQTSIDDGNFTQKLWIGGAG